MAPLISHIDDYRQLRSTFKKKKKYIGLLTCVAHAGRDRNRRLAQDRVARAIGTDAEDCRWARCSGQMEGQLRSG